MLLNDKIKCDCDASNFKLIWAITLKNAAIKISIIMLLFIAKNLLLLNSHYQEL